ncbi:SpaA isopeptide-forming pilin-related protein [Paenibacillus arenosi]|uniref:LPXTG cell wall anchor domain-containing protein n=1 Tax=Paenibacillus arenosi TaxID=2774142 RepID=A0ABR9B367_9BACL|nr:SpaA isopeptide-forming pilin-related protein [Paenibacillus arenosi]MBD8499611.1 LPXTG cell wall anchor domain-containing protein [Paenibacillus arenosi]
MHKYNTRTFFCGLLVISILVNLVLPPSLVVANSGQGTPLFPISSHSNQSVSNATYGNNTSVTGSTYGVISTNIITSVTITDEKGNNITQVRPNLDEKVQVDLTWKLPAGHPYGNGSTFTFQLPDKFKVDRKLEGQLDGKVGTYVVTPEGKVTFTFNDLIKGGQEIEGDFFVWRYFNKDKFTGGTHQNIEFVFEADSIIIPVHFKGKDNGNMNKQGKANKGMNASEINWIVDINTGEQKIDQAVFTDKLPAGLTIDLGSIRLYKVDVKLDGTLHPETNPIPGITPQQTADGFELPLGDIHNAYRVTYTTKIDGTVDAFYKNQATVTGTNLTKSLVGTTTVEVKYSKPLGKQKLKYDRDTQSVNWSIQYNYNEQRIGQAKAYIEDHFDKTKMKRTGDVIVTQMIIDDNGTAKQVGAPLVAGTDYVIDDTVSHGFTVKFLKDIEHAYEIKYKTEAINRVHQDVSITNKVIIPDNKDNITVGETLTQAIFHKSAVGTNYADKTIGWKLELNADKKRMDNVVITDNIKGQNMAFIADSFAVSGLKKDVDYKVEPHPQYSEGFKLTFLVNITEKHEITYRTKFDPTANKSLYSNKATLNWEENGVAQPSITKTATVTPDSYTQDNGNKTGVYDAATKEITWTIDINYNLHTINDPVLRDYYKGKQTFLKDSFKVQHLTLSGNQNTVTPGALVPPSEYSFDDTVKNAAGDQGFELRFNQPINSAYRITYKTSLKGLAVEGSYSNHAILHDGANPTKNLFEKTATVTPKHNKEYVFKNGKQGTGANSEFAYWQVHINRSQSFITAGSTLTDTLSTNQILLPDTIKLYHYTVGTDGTVRKGSAVNSADYTLAAKGNTLSLTFNKDIETAYLLEYTSFINAGNKEKITNKVSFKGQSTGTVNEDNNGEVEVSFSGAGGGGSIVQKGNIKILKEDKITKQPLAGAKFGLYDKSGSMLLQEVVTDANGEATFTNFKYNEYIIKELEAPTGYVLHAQYTGKGKIVQVNNALVPVTVPNTKDEWGVVLTKVDADAPTKLLDGAVFKLQADDGSGSYQDVAGHTNLKTVKGKIAVNGLKPGNYQLIEVAAPTGYKLDNTPIKFTIDSNQQKSKTLTARNKQIRGSVELTKVDASDTSKTIAGAVFQLQDRTGKALRSGLTTAQSGRLPIGNLPVGSYQLVETKAPVGYVLDPTPLKFNIVDEQMLTFTFENNKSPGSLKLIKIETGKPTVTLAGAQFRLLDEHQQPVTDKAGKPLPLMTTSTNGQLIIPALQPGKYFAEEVVAPKGYLIVQKLTEFHVVSDKETVVTVENMREPLPGSLKLIKIETGKPSVTLAGAQFQLLDEHQQPVTDKAGKPLPLMTTGTNGELTVPALKAGKYFVEEVKAPDGYLIEQTLTEFVIVSEKETLLKIENKPEPLPGSLKLIKIETGKPTVTLADAQFRILDENQQPVIDKAGKPLPLMTTDADGIIKIPTLKPGKYFAEEVIAPKGYLIENKLTEFTIVSEKETVVSVENKFEPLTGSLKLIKIETGKPTVTLGDAQFRLLDANQQPVTDLAGQPLALMSTDKNGQLMIPTLKPGNYFIEEVKAPEGYLIEQKLTEFTIVSEQETVVTVENKRKPVPPQPPIIIPPVDGGEETPEQPDGGSDNDKDNPPDGGTDNGTDNPSDGGSDNGTDNPSDGGSDNGTDNPSDGGSDNGTDNPADGGSDNGTDNPSDGGSDNGTINPPDSGSNGSTDHPSDGGSSKNETPDKTKDKSSNHVLPKTGEESSLPMQLAGFILMLLGAALLVTRKKWLKS